MISLFEIYKMKRKDESDRLKYELCGRAYQQGICNGKCLGKYYQCAWLVRRNEDDQKICDRT